MKFINSNNLCNKNSLLKNSKKKYKFFSTLFYFFLINYNKNNKKFNYNLNNSVLLDFFFYKKSLIKKEQKYILSSDIISFLSTNGNNHFKNTILYFNMFSLFYKLMLLNKLDNNSILTDYKYYKEFLYNFSLYSNYNNFNYLLNWVFSWIQPMFAIECSIVSKKYRKKLKRKYLYRIKYIKKFQRKSKTIKWITQYSKTLPNKNFKNQQFLTYLDLLFNYKNSYIYNKKLLVYKKLFKI